MQIQQTENALFLQNTQLIQSNTQYLTVVRSLVTHQARTQNQSLRTLESYMESYGTDSKSKLNYEMLCQLMIELGYFLFACRSFGVKPLIEMADIKAEESYYRSNDKKFGVVIFYKLQAESMEENEGVMLYHGIFEHIEANLTSILENKEANSNDQFEVTFDTFCQQYKAIAGCSFFESNELQFFQALEQTNLFYEYSLLYRIKNCSIVDFIKGSNEKMDAFKVHKIKDLQHLTQYKQQRHKFRNDPDSLKNKEKQINTNLIQFFQKINQNFKEMVKSQKQPSNKINFLFAIQEKAKIPLETVIQKFQGQQSTMSQEGKVDPRRPLSKMEYYVEYSSEKNIICVRLMVPSIMVNVQTSDFLMFQSNVLTFQAVNVTIQLSEPKNYKPEANNNKPPPKIVTFKGTSSFNVKEPPLEKILLLMDMTMIAARLYEPELNPSKYCQSKDTYHKLSMISKKMTHYTKLLMKLGKKIYSE